MLWQWSLIALLFLLPFSVALNPSATVDLAMIRVMVPFVFFLWGLDSLIKKQVLIDKRPRFWLFAGFLFLAGLSFFWALDQERAIKKILFLFPFFILYFSVYAFSRMKGSAALLWPIFLGSLLAALLGILQFSLQFIIGIDPAIQLLSQTVIPFFQGENFAKLITQYPSWLVNVNGLTLMRAFGSFPDPHLFSLYLNLSLPAALYLCLSYNKRWLWAGLMVILTASILSFSRAAYLSLAAAGIFLLACSPLAKIARKKPLPALIGIIAIILLMVLPNPLTQRFIASFNLQEGSNSGRLQMWQRAVDLTVDYPITGVGLGNFSRVIVPDSLERNPIYAHNLFLDFSSETGIIAALLLMAALLCPVFYFFRSPFILPKMLAASFIVLLVHCLFETPFYSVNVFPLIIALLAIHTDPL